MWNRILPIVIIVTSNCFYNICAKSMPEGINAFGALVVTYLVGAVISAVFFLLAAAPRGISGELTKLNWVPFALGIAIVGLEAGYVMLYRAGWALSTGALTANICLAVALLIVGVLLFQETITLKQLAGILVCAIGLFLIA